MNERMKPGVDAPYNMAESLVPHQPPCNGEPRPGGAFSSLPPGQSRPD